MATDSGTITALGAFNTTLEAPADTATDAAVATFSSAFEAFTEEATDTATMSGSHVEAKAGDVTVGGTTEVHPTTTVEGPCYELELRNLTTGARLFWRGMTLFAGDYLVIDHYTRTATLNDASISTRGVEGTFWPLVPGVNRISAGATSNTDTAENQPTGLTITMRFKQAYR